MLNVKNISVAIEDHDILRSINLTCLPGTVHALMGPNGSGKSTLAHTIMGSPMHTVISGNIEFEGEVLNDLSIEKRARKGIFLTFQQPPQLEGVQVFTFLHESYKALKSSTIEFAPFFHKLETLMEHIGIDRSLVERHVNVGFSGGQKKILELLQLLLFEPRVVLCDEIDSGLDVDALKMVVRGLEYLKKKNPDAIIIIITHYQKLLQYIQPDYVHVVRDGTIVKSGDKTIAEDIDLLGYDAV